MAAEPGIVVSLHGVGFDYGDLAAVDGVTADIGSGITGLLGLNGVGKTTLLRMIATATRPARGRITILGKDAHARDLAPIRRRLGYLPQDAAWASSVRVRDMLRVFAWMRHIPRRDIEGKVSYVLCRTAMSGLAERRLGTLSGGEYRRAMLAQALLAEPGILILDEPTAGLDPRQRVQIREMLVDIATDTAVMISTHLLEDVSTIADRLLVLDGGRLVFSGSSAELAGNGDGVPSATALEKGFLRVIDTDTLDG